MAARTKRASFPNPVRGNDGVVTRYFVVMNVPIDGDWANGSRRMKRTFKVADYGTATDARSAAWSFIREIEDARSKKASSSLLDGRKTLKDYRQEHWDMIMTYRQLKPKVRKTYARDWVTYIEPVVGSVRLCEFRRSDIERLKAVLLGQELSGSRVNDVLNALSKVLDYATTDGVIDFNPVAVRGVRVRERSRSDPAGQAISPEQLERLVIEIVKRGGEMRGLAVRVAFWTGLRAGELWALKVENVDIESRRIRVMRADLGTDETGKRVFGLPKNHRKRDVPIFDAIVDGLRDLVKDRDGDEWLFPAGNGSATLHTNFYKAVDWREAVEDADIPGFRFHDLRHSCVSYMQDCHVDPHMVASIVGHSSLDMVRHYSHVRSESLDRAIEHVRA